MDLPICKDDMMNCVDILGALTKDFFASKGNVIEEVVEVNDVNAAVVRPGYETVGSTLTRQREMYCAWLIQKTWKKFKNQGKKRTGKKLEKQVRVDDDTYNEVSSSAVLDD